MFQEQALSSHKSHKFEHLENPFKNVLKFV